MLIKNLNLILTKQKSYFSCRFPTNRYIFKKFHNSNNELFKSYQQLSVHKKPLKKSSISKTKKFQRSIFLLTKKNFFSKIKILFNGNQKNNSEKKEQKIKVDTNTNEKIFPQEIINKKLNQIKNVSSINDINVNVNSTDLKKKSEEMIKLIKLNIDDYSIEHLFDLLFIMHSLKIKDHNMLRKIEKRIQNCFIDMKNENQSKIIFYFSSLDYYSNKFYFLIERFLIKKIDELNIKNFLLVLPSLTKNSNLSPGLISLLEKYVEKNFNHFQISQMAEVFLGLGKIYDKFNFYFNNRKEFELYKKIWVQINTHMNKIPINLIVDIYYMVYSVDSKKINQKNFLKYLNIYENIETSKLKIFEILNIFYNHFYQENFNKIDDENNERNIIEQNNKTNNVDDCVTNLDLFLKNLPIEDNSFKDELLIDQKSYLNVKYIYKIILSHHFGDDAFFNFSDFYNENINSYIEDKIENKLSLIMENNLANLKSCKISNLFKFMPQIYYEKILLNPKSINMKVEILKFNYFIYNEISKGINLMMPDEINSIFNILLMEKSNKSKFLFMGMENNFENLIQQYLDCIKKDYLEMSVEEHCIYLQTIYQILKYNSTTEEFKLIKYKAKERFDIIVDEINLNRIRKLNFNQIVSIFDVYKYIGNQVFYKLDIVSILKKLIFLLENETSDNFEKYFDNYFHLVILIYDISLDGQENLNFTIDEFWVKFSKYSKLFLGSKFIDINRLKKLLSLLDEKLNKNRI